MLLLPNKRGLQRVVVSVQIVVPIQKGAHADRILERVREAVGKELHDEIVTAEGLLISAASEVNALEASVFSRQTSTDFTAFAYNRETHLTQGDAWRILLSLPTKYAWQAVEYIEEAEHQDGVEYWMNFHTAKELVDDFRLYTQGVNADVALRIDDGPEDSTAHHHQ